MTAQIIVIGINILTAGIYLARHGEPRNEEYNFWLYMLGSVISNALLYWGGFYDVFFK